MNRETVAESIYSLNPALQPWDGDTYTFAEAKMLANDEKAQLAYRQADAVIACV